MLFYLLAGVAAGLAHAYLNPGSIVPTVGASGAISGVLGGYLVLFPRARVLTLFVLLLFFVQVVEVPAALYLGFWFLMQLVSGTASLALAEDGTGSPPASKALPTTARFLAAHTRQGNDHEQDEIEDGAGPCAATGHGAGPSLPATRPPAALA